MCSSDLFYFILFLNLYFFAGVVIGVLFLSWFNLPGKKNVVLPFWYVYILHFCLSKRPKLYVHIIKIGNGLALVLQCTGATVMQTCDQNWTRVTFVKLNTCHACNDSSALEVSQIHKDNYFLIFCIISFFFLIKKSC